MKLAVALTHLPEIVMNLLIHPAYRCSVKGDRQAHRQLRSNARSAMKKIGESGSADSERFRSFGDTQSQRFKAQLLENLTRVWWVVHAQIVHPLNGSLHNRHPLRFRLRI